MSSPEETTAADTKSPAKPRGSTRQSRPPEAPTLQRYLNRELTWLEFNARVLDQATDDHHPLLERVKFLAISGSTLDEYFMKRLGGLKQQVAAEVEAARDRAVHPEPDVQGHSIAQQARRRPG